MIGIEFVADKESKRPFPAEAKLVDRMVKTCFDLGLVVYPGSGHINGELGDTILLAPPFVITPEQIDEAADILARAADVVEREMAVG